MRRRVHWAASGWQDPVRTTRPYRTPSRSAERADPQAQAMASNSTQCAQSNTAGGAAAGLGLSVWRGFAALTAAERLAATTEANDDTIAAARREAKERRCREWERREAKAAECERQQQKAAVRIQAWVRMLRVRWARRGQDAQLRAWIHASLACASGHAERRGEERREELQKERREERREERR